jgi:hypothetical protein
LNEKANKLSDNKLKQICRLIFNYLINCCNNTSLTLKELTRNEDFDMKPVYDYITTNNIELFDFNNIRFEDIDINNPTNKPTQLDQTAVDYGKGTYQAGANGTIKSPTTRQYTELQKAIKTSITQVTDNGKSKFTTSLLTKDIDKNSVLKTLLKDVFARTEKDQDEKILSIIFTIINPFDQSPEPISLSAYIKGFRDNFDATWNEYNYVGRSESFYTYGKFKRNIGFSLDIPCFNKAELLDKYRKLGQLASTTAGAYNENNLLGGVIIRLTIGNHINGDYGLLTNLSYEIPDDSSWDIDEGLAMYIKATFSFTIIQANLPKYTQNGLFASGPAALNNESNQLQQSTRDLLRKGPPTVDEVITSNPISPTLLRDLLNPLNRG